MYEIKKETLLKAYKPFDIVTNEKGDVGFIQEVGVNECQPDFDLQIGYSVMWLVGDERKCAWFSHSELKRHGNLMKIIAKALTHPMSSNERWVDQLFSHIEDVDS